MYIPVNKKFTSSFNGFTDQIPSNPIDHKQRAHELMFSIGTNAASRMLQTILKLPLGGYPAIMALQETTFLSGISLNDILASSSSPLLAYPLTILVQENTSLTPMVSKIPLAESKQPHFTFMVISISSFTYS
jgi:hypothetical protein